MTISRVSVIGTGRCDTDDEKELYQTAIELGRQLAQSGYSVVCGGLGGVMEGVCKGAIEKGGETIGILPYDDRSLANEWVSTPIATGLGQMRNMLVVMNGDVVVAVGGRYGTLSEVALAKKSGKQVIAIGSMSQIDGVVEAKTASQVMQIIKEMGIR